MARQTLWRAAARPIQRGACLYLLQQQSLAAPITRLVSSGLGLGSSQSSARAPIWALASRMASTVREVGREADGGLTWVLGAELDHETKTYSQAKEVARGPPKPWTLTDETGHADVILRRSYGQEDIAVTCVYQADPYGDNPERDEEDHDGGGSCVDMTITIDKGADNPTLEISAASYGTEITIDHVYFHDNKDFKEVKYDGPNFLQLDEEVQNQFERFIKARGVNKELTGYLFTLQADKEQRDYMRGFLEL